MSLDTAQVAILDAMYLLADEDHSAGRSAEDVVPGYDGAWRSPSTLTTTRTVAPSVSASRSASGTPLRCPSAAAWVVVSTRWQAGHRFLDAGASSSTC